MAFKSKDGKRNFGNRQQAQAYDSRSSQSKKGAPGSAEHEAGESPEFEAGEQEGAQEASEMPIEEHVAEHGPAEKVEIHHSEGKHTKISHHGGAKHVSHHDSAEEAHQHGMMAAGVGHEEPDGDEAAPAMAGGGDGSIPGM